MADNNIIVQFCMAVKAEMDERHESSAFFPLIYHCGRPQSLLLALSEPEAIVSHLSLRESQRMSDSAAQMLIPKKRSENNDRHASPDNNLTETQWISNETFS